MNKFFDTIKTVLFAVIPILFFILLIIACIYPELIKKHILFGFHIVMGESKYT